MKQNHNRRQTECNAKFTWVLPMCEGDKPNVNDDITPLRKYIAIGYAVIALLIGGVALIYLFEWRELELIEAESTKAFLDILNKTY